jgi:hypothetical protein
MKIEDVTHRTVCEYLLRSSNVKDDFSALSDEGFDKYMKDFAAKHNGNPAMVWLGYDPRNKRRPVKWKRVSGMDVKTIKSKGLNPEWNDALKSVDWNLCGFIAERQDVHGNREYRQDEMPHDDLSLIIGVVHPDKRNEVELLDGSHRLASMLIIKQIKTVDGYVGY